MKIHRRLTFLTAAILSVAAGTALALEPSSVTLKAARADILINETTLLTLTPAELLGGRPTVEWSTNLGTVTPLKEGDRDFRSDLPSATFTSDRSGRAVVTAILRKGDGNNVSDSTVITVNPLRVAP